MKIIDKLVCPNPYYCHNCSHHMTHDEEINYYLDGNRDGCDVGNRVRYGKRVSESIKKTKTERDWYDILHFRPKYMEQVIYTPELFCEDYVSK